MCTAICQNARVRLKRCRTVKKIKPVALTIIELCLSEGISQLVTQSVSKKFHLKKFCSNLLKAFRVDLKGLFGLSFTCLIVVREK